jgi:hypothetical protein
MHLAMDLSICYNVGRQKRDDVQDERRNESPNRTAIQLRDSSFSFIVAKHPLGYLSPL